NGGGAATSFCPAGCGTIFKITPGGKLTTLHSFDEMDGATPEATLVLATDGNFYGTTFGGGGSNGCLGGCGTIFKITPGGTLTTLHRFDGTDGKFPGALVQASDGKFYGTNGAGGANTGACGSGGCGTVFKITAGGTLTTLHNFDFADGFSP